MDNSTKNNSLMHFGVLGMRWGHRKAQETGGSSSGHSSDHRLLSKLNRKSINDLSDAELKSINSRVKMMATLRSYDRNVYKPKELAKLSNKELSDIIKRERLMDHNPDFTPDRVSTMSSKEVKKRLGRTLLEEPARVYIARQEMTDFAKRAVMTLAVSAAAATATTLATTLAMKYTGN